MRFDALIVRAERGVMRRLPPGMVCAANARLHQWKGEPELAELSRLVTPGTIAVDVGAHFGTYSHTLGRLVGRGGKVISIEPVEEDAAFLRKAMRQLRLPVEVHACALSSTVGTGSLHVPSRHGKQKTALSSLEAHDEDTDSRTVPLTTLDTLIAGASLPVSFVKIDVEGHEIAVLDGAQRTIEEHKPNLLVEIEGRFLSYPVSSVIERILALGYHGEFLNATGQRRPVSEFDELVHQDRALDPLDRRYIHNFIFTPA